MTSARFLQEAAALPGPRTESRRRSSACAEAAEFGLLIVETGASASIRFSVA